jgi:sugar lactone lactonase YvrE
MNMSFKPILLFVALASSLIACGDTTPKPTITITPLSSTVVAGVTTQTFTATTQNPPGIVQWKLEPATGAGTINPTTGASVIFTPPASVASTTAVSLTAYFIGSTLKEVAVITVNPDPSVIGAAGGTVTSTNSLASLVIPSGAITTAGKWKVLPVANSALPVLPTLDPYELVAGSAFEIQADNPALSKNAEFSIDSTSFPTTAGLSASFGILTYSSVNNAWTELLPTIVNAKYSVTCLSCKTFVLYKRQQVLWVPNYNTAIIKGYSSKQRATDFAGTPFKTITLPSGSKPNAVAFDSSGNMWVTDNAGSRLLKYAPVQWLTSGSPAPSAIITPGFAKFRQPIGLAFDSSGQLWVANANGVTMLTPAQLSTTGSPDPALLSGGASYFGIPAGLAFDQAGSLWISQNSANNLTKFTAATLANVGTIPVLQADKVIAEKIDAAPSLGNNLSSLSGPEGIAFDTTGNLWVGNNVGYSLVKYTGLQLVQGVSPTTPAPNVFIGYNGTSTRSVQQMGGVAIDASGNVWVNNETTNAVLGFTPANLSATGVPEASIVIDNATTNPCFGGLAFSY